MGQVTKHMNEDVAYARKAGVNTVFFSPTSVLQPGTNFVDVCLNSHTHNSRVLTFGVLSYFTITRVRISWLLSRCHVISVYLHQNMVKLKARWEKYPSYNCLIGGNKKRERGKLSLTSLAMLQYTGAPAYEDRGRSLKTRSDRNLPFYFWLSGSLPYFSALM